MANIHVKFDQTGIYKKAPYLDIKYGFPAVEYFVLKKRFTYTGIQGLGRRTLVKEVRWVFSGQFLKQVVSYKTAGSKN